MGPFSFGTPAAPDEVFARLRQLGSGRSGASHPAVHALDGNLVVRLRPPRFRAWIEGRRAVGPVAEGEAVPGLGGTALTGRLHWSWPDRIFTPIWAVWPLVLGVASGDWSFVLPIAVAWAAFGGLWWVRVVRPREAALLAVLAQAAAGAPVRAERPVGAPVA